MRERGVVKRVPIVVVAAVDEMWITGVYSIVVIENARDLTRFGDIRRDPMRFCDI